MTASAERIALALAACEGMSDEDLKERGAGGFLKMIHRKRGYAQVARSLQKQNEDLHKSWTKIGKKLDTLQAEHSALIEQLQDADLSSTKTAAEAVLSLFTLGQAPKTE